MLSFLENKSLSNQRNTSGLRSITLQDACFPLTHRDLFYYGSNTLPAQSGYKALMAADTEEILYVGPEYSPVPNADVLTALTTLESDGWQLDEIKGLNRRVFYFKAVHPEIGLKVGGLDANATITVLNSYDGSQALKVFVGASIKVCSNGLTIGKGVEYKRKHIGKGTDDFEAILKETAVYGIQEAIRKAEAKEWELEDVNKMEKIWKQLVKPYPKATNGQDNKLVLALNQRFFEEQRLGYKGELAMMMAATHVATHDYAAHSGSYIMQLERDIPKVFFN